MNSQKDPLPTYHNTKTMVHMQLTAAKTALSPCARRWASSNGSRSLKSSLLSATTSGGHSRSLSALSFPTSTSTHYVNHKYQTKKARQWTNYQQFVHLSTTATATDDTSSESTTNDTPNKPKDEMEFQAETRQLLDIVTHSLYTDKEVFLRELVSNASDALEKLRHVQATGTLSGSSSADDSGEDKGENIPLEIRITTDEAGNTLTITDTGIGMSKEEM